MEANDTIEQMKELLESFNAETPGELSEAVDRVRSEAAEVLQRLNGLHEVSYGLRMLGFQRRATPMELQLSDFAQVFWIKDMNSDGTIGESYCGQNYEGVFNGQQLSLRVSCYDGDWSVGYRFRITNQQTKDTVFLQLDSASDVLMNVSAYLFLKGLLPPNAPSQDTKTQQEEGEA
jgi:hypothetical protein